MPVNKKQLQRLVRFVAMLKENRYPNCSSFIEELKKDDLYGNKNVLCTSKTIQRDINTLKNDFDAPIEYDFENKGYYLTHHGWNFPCPLFEEHEMIASVLGSRIAEDIFPEPLKSQIRSAVDFQLSTNNPDILDSAYIRSLIVYPGLKVQIDRQIFNDVFEAWKTHKAIDICYKDVADRISRRTIEPHALVFHDYAWFIRAYCLKQESPRTFAVHRIAETMLTNKKFTPDAKIINSVLEYGPFEYKSVKNVHILCDNQIKKFVVEKQLHKDQQIEKENNKTFVLIIPQIWDFVLIQWILFQGGSAKLLEPKYIKEKINKAAKKILDSHKT